MGYASYFDVARAWVRRCRAADHVKIPNNPRMPVTGDRIYSYGPHLEIGRGIRNKRGELTFFLLNGDNYSVTTSRHQREIRSAVQRTGVPYVIIPYGTLSAAGISDLNTVSLLEATSDQIEVTKHQSTELPPGYRWADVPVYGYVDLTEQEIKNKLSAKQGKNNYDHALQLRYAKDDPEGYWAKHWLPNNPEPAKATLHPGEYREWRQIDIRRAIVRGNSDRGPWGITATPQEDGTYVYTWETRRHWLGESLIEATVTWSRQHTCRTCKGTGVSPDAPEIPADPDRIGPWPLRRDYPATDEGSAAFAVADREHERAWHAQLKLGNEWRRQWQGTCPNKSCRGRGRWITTHKRRAKFLSGFDHNETRRCYFFCELPKMSETTVAAAYDALKPTVVHYAERVGREVRRQGDIFAIETAFTTRDLRRRGAVFSKRTHLIGTNHTATQVATLPDGTTFARGCLYHEPERRRPDHSRIKVPSGWSLIAKNTVPVTKR